MAALVQRLGLTGAVLILVAGFLPMWGAREGDVALDLSLFDMIRFVPMARDELGISGADIDDAIVGSAVAFALIVLVAVAGYVMALLGARRTLLIPGLAGLAAGVGLLAYSLAETARINDEIGSGLDVGVHLSWGWAVYFPAAVMLIVAGALGFVRCVGPSLAGDGGPSGRQADEATSRSAAGWEPASQPRGWMLSGKSAAGRRIRLRLDEDDLAAPEGLVLGRGPTLADVLVDDESVSRAHVRVTLGAAGLIFEDLGSTNGTRIDGRRLTEGGGEAEAGAEIAIGDVRFVLSRR